MNRYGKICWWLIVTAVGICFQAVLPGQDLLAVGFLLLLQESDYATMLWWVPLVILLQEGMGTRLFGGTIVWYILIAVLFYLGRWLFEARNFFFVFILSACLGVAYFCVAWFMAPLQNIQLDQRELLDVSLVQAFVMPLVWCIMVLVKSIATRDEVA